MSGRRSGVGVLEGEADSIWKNTDKDKASVELEFEACLSHAAGPFPVQPEPIMSGRERSCE
jgi:hypothetical protein